jgi:holo-[acyl-carrier protein] synthase
MLTKAVIVDVLADVDGILLFVITGCESEQIYRGEKSMIIGTGVDIVEIERFRKILDRLKDRFIFRVFTPGEQSYCHRHRDPVPHFAVRFAAKEAAFKALGTGWARGVTWQDVEVQREGQYAPVILLHGEAQRISASLGARRAHLSLSHSDRWAVATVILEE